ncbi:probable calcium-binding protein CML21 isoform X2 [Cucumis melo]|uniref:Probable calcium-binding protein CML21 isoform X2 n=1 Tax=Cucumis melo TaxID=3656 RepID=A0ABM3KWP4_CUCME|nr:probable calcium-binding protein CML21 isoform X2 [Cucumis melo]
MGSVVGKLESPRECVPETKLEAKMVETMRRRATKGSIIRSFDCILLKFPKIDDSLRNCKTIFQQFDEDLNGIIDRRELKKCFDGLEILLTEEEIDDLFEACDISAAMGIKFNEFIKSQFGMPKLEETFESLVDAFVFLDKNKDGYVSKSEMISAINETTSGERSSGRIAMRRFEEMDWDKNGMVNFKEFLFAFTRWVGIDENEEEE